MRKAFVVGLASSLFLLLIAIVINKTQFGEEGLSKQYRIPRTCISEGQNAYICYTCLRRSMSQELRHHPILISSAKEFSFMVFGDRTHFTCDQLFQLVQSRSYIGGQSLKSQYLQSVYDTIRQLKGSISRVKVLGMELETGQQEVIIVQVVKEQQRKQSFVKAITVSIQTQQKLTATISILIIISFSLTILLELVKLRTQIKWKCSLLFNLLLILVVFLQLSGSTNSFVNQQVNSLQMILFFMALLWNQTDIVVYIFYLLLLFFMSYQWATVVFVIIFMVHNYSLLINEGQRNNFVSLHIFFTVLVFTVNWFYLSYHEPIWETVLENIIYWLILLYGPLINSILEAWSYRRVITKVKQKSSMRGHQDEQATLNHIHF